MLIPLLPIATLLAMLVMLEPDLGTTLIVVTVLMTLLWVVGAPARLFAGLLSVIGMLVTYLAVAEPYRLARLASFADPFKDSQDTGWQAVQGLYALASGGWWGVGLGASREKWSYLPNAHTDFILAIIGEELGLLGTLLVVVLFCVLAYGGIRVAQRSSDQFGRLVAAAITAWLVGQALINMGAVVGLLPITGIPLPLISFGGSSLLITMFAIGILLSLAKTEPAAAQVIAARAATRSASRLAGRRQRFAFLRFGAGKAKKRKNGKQNQATPPPRSRGTGARAAGTARKTGRETRGTGGRSTRRGRLGSASGSRRDGRSRRRLPSR
jgi:cell division protein FtsW